MAYLLGKLSSFPMKFHHKLMDSIGCFIHEPHISLVHWFILGRKNDNILVFLIFASLCQICSNHFLDTWGFVKPFKDIKMIHMNTFCSSCFFSFCCSGWDFWNSCFWSSNFFTFCSYCSSNLVSGNRSYMWEVKKERIRVRIWCFMRSRNEEDGKG